jgi:hypothetical protein
MIKIKSHKRENTWNKDFGSKVKKDPHNHILLGCFDSLGWHICCHAQLSCWQSPRVMAF